VITLATVTSSLAACGGSTTSDSQGSGGSGNVGGSGGSGNVGGAGGSGNVSGSGGSTAGCPATFPDNGTLCSLPSGTTCMFSQGACCPAWDATCVDGKWVGYGSTCNPPPPDPCPNTVPTDGASCGSSDPCGNSYNYCTYGKCLDGPPGIVAECNGSAWKVSYANCPLQPCEVLEPCACFERPDCTPVSNGCICECDYNCPGKLPCDCACGGGQYLGCKPLEG